MSMLATTSSDSASCGCKSQPVSVGPALFCIAALIIGGAVGFSPGAPLIGTAQAQSAEPKSCGTRTNGGGEPDCAVAWRDAAGGHCEIEWPDRSDRSRRCEQIPRSAWRRSTSTKATRSRLGRSSPPSHRQKPKPNCAGRTGGSQSQTGLCSSRRADSPAQKRFDHRQNGILSAENPWWGKGG